MTVVLKNQFGKKFKCSNYQWDSLWKLVGNIDNLSAKTYCSLSPPVCSIHIDSHEVNSIGFRLYNIVTKTHKFEKELLSIHDNFISVGMLTKLHGFLNKSTSLDVYNV